MRLFSVTASPRATSHSAGPSGVSMVFDHMPTEDELLHIAERRRPYRRLAASYPSESEFEAKQ
jgi:hypothetical protein